MIVGVRSLPGGQALPFNRHPPMLPCSHSSDPGGCQAGCGSFVAEATLGFLGDILGRHSYAIDTAMWAKVCLAFKFRSTSLA